jgi:thiol-disulfide isomerase/thioredoxin
VAEFFMLSCPGCRTLLPKLHSIAANNPDVDFVKINVEEPGMADVARGAGIERMPGFALYRDGGARVAAFSITLARVAVLRAEIAANKECVGECAFHEGEA